jgi:hypothetical protein
MKKQLFLWIAAVTILLVITACGGGGASVPTPNPGPFVSVRIEAVLTTGSSSVDASNIFPKEAVTFRLTGIGQNDTTQTRVTIPTTGWTSTGTIGGTLSTNGSFVANDTPPGSSGTVKITYDGSNYSLLTRVVQPEAILKGKGRLTDGRPTAKITIQALNSSGNVVAFGNVAADGTIRMSVPTNATRITADFSGVDPGATFYVRQFFYNTKDYSTLISGCTAPLPALTNGVTTNLLSDIVFYQNSGGPPPPPPSGC